VAKRTARSRIPGVNPSTERGYGRFCPVSLSLDKVGDRWTLLLINQLLFGPQRFTDLKGYLDGAGSNILGDRLRRLAKDGIVGRNAGSEPGSPITYYLTDRGMALEPAIRSLFRWGLLDLIAAETRAPDRVVFDQRWAIGPHEPLKLETYQWTIDGYDIELVIDGYELQRTRGKAKNPAATLRTTTDVFLKLVSGKTSPAEAAAAGLFEVKGSRAAVKRMFLATGFPIA
jgi:DNA-binding HxlR family transcriptional regulator/putative sterol carrier protein